MYILDLETELCTDLPVGDGKPSFHERDMRVFERVGRPLGAELDQAEAVGRLGE